MRINICLLIITLFLTACASNKGGYTNTSQVENRLIGMEKYDVLMKLGAPTQMINMSDTEAVYSYRDRAEGVTGGSCTVNIVVKDDVVVKADVISQDRSFVSFPLGGCVHVLGNLD